MEGNTPSALVKDNIINNLIDHKGSTDAIAVYVEDNPSGGSVKINYNDFTNTAIGVARSGSSVGTVNAKDNYWGHCSGPGPVAAGSGSGVSADVTYTPWLGICLEEKLNDSCSFVTKDARITANVTGNYLEDVWFSYTINGVNYNKTAFRDGGNNYYYDIFELKPSSVSYHLSLFYPAFQ